MGLVRNPCGMNRMELIAKLARKNVPPALAKPVGV